MDKPKSIILIIFFSVKSKFSGLKSLLNKSELPVNDIIFVNVFESVDNLSKKQAGFTFPESSLFHNIIEQLSFRSVFHDNKEVFRVFDDFIYLDDINMVQFLEERDFSLDSFTILIKDNFCLFKYFDCHFFVSR